MYVCRRILCAFFAYRRRDEKFLANNLVRPPALLLARARARAFFLTCAVGVRSRPPGSPPLRVLCWPFLRCSCVRTRRTSRRFGVTGLAAVPPHPLVYAASALSVALQPISTRGSSSRKCQGMARGACRWGGPLTLSRPFPCAAISGAHAPCRYSAVLTSHRNARLNGVDTLFPHESLRETY